MRKLVGVFGGFCCAVVIALVARFAYKTADNDIDAYINAFMYATIAAGGLGGHAVAVRVWKRSKVWSVLLGVISAVALMVNISNSLGAIAGRGDAKAAERLKQTEFLRDLRRDVKRLAEERNALGVVPMTSVDAVRAAREEVEAAAKRAETDCARYLNTCQKARDTESQKRAALTKLTAERATAERADKIDGELKELNAAIAKAQPVGSGNAQATALARLFGLDGDQSSIIYWQYLAVSIVVELLIVGALVGHELMQEPEAATRRETPQDDDAQRGRALVATVVAPVKMRELPKPQEAPKPAAIVAAPVVPQQPAPKPVVNKVSESNPVTPPAPVHRRAIGDIAAFAVERLSPASGAMVPMDTVYGDYSAWCQTRDETAVTRAAFEHWFRTIGKELGIGIVVRGSHMLCRNVTLAA